MTHVQGNNPAPERKMTPKKIGRETAVVIQNSSKKQDQMETERESVFKNDIEHWREKVNLYLMRIIHCETISKLLQFIIVLVCLTFWVYVVVLTIENTIKIFL